MERHNLLFVSLLGLVVAVPAGAQSTLSKGDVKGPATTTAATLPTTMGVASPRHGGHFFCEFSYIAIGLRSDYANPISFASGGQTLGQKANQAYDALHFFFTAIGQRPDYGNPASLSPEGLVLWQKATATYDALRAVVPENNTAKPAVPPSATAPSPRQLKEELHTSLTGLAALYSQNPRRLDALALRQVGKYFDQWLAESRWDVLVTPNKFGQQAQLDVKSVSALEKPALIGLLRGKSPEVLEPLKAYFPVPPAPPPRRQPGQQAAPVVRPPDPIMTITAVNAIEVKEKAALAAVVLLAQMKLEPEMPLVDKSLLNTQLMQVNRILSRAQMMEPAARMAKEKAERDKRQEEERQRIEALRRK